MFSGCFEEPERRLEMSIIQAFRDIQRESTEILSSNILQLQQTMSHANEIHRQQLYALQQMDTNGKANLPCNMAVIPASESSTQALTIALEPQGKEEARQRTETQHHPQPTIGIDCYKRKSTTSSRSSRVCNLFESEPLKVVHGSAFTWGVGKGGHRIVLDYSFDRLRFYSAIPAIFSRPSIFMLRPSLFVQLLFQSLLVAFFAVGVIAFWSHRLEGNNLKDTAAGKALDFINNALQRLVPFLLGLFISLQLSRWWTIRSQYLHKIHVCSAQLSMQLGLILPGQGKHFRKRIETYLLLAHKVLFLCGRLQQDQLDNHNIDGNETMTAEEMRQLVSSISKARNAMKGQIGVYDFAAAQLPIMWTTQLLFQLFQYSKDSGEIYFPINILMHMLSQCGHMEKAMQDIEMILNCPLPFQYVHLVTLVVHVSTIYTSIETGVHIGIMYLNDQLTVGSLATRYLSMVMVNGLYLGLLCLVTVLMNPFTEQLSSFPFENMECRMRKLMTIHAQMFFGRDSIDAMIAQEFGRHDEATFTGKSEESKKLEELLLNDIDILDDEDEDDADDGK